MRVPLLLATLSTLLLASCATAPGPPPRAMPAPEAAADVAPLVDTARADAKAAGVISEKLESKVHGLQQTAGTLRESVAAATAEADRLRNQQAASRAELEALWQVLVNTEDHAKRLFQEAEAARAAADEQRAARISAEARLDELAAAAAARDSETLELRKQRTALAAQLDQAAIDHQKLSERLTAAEKSAAVGSYLRTVLWVLIGLAFLVCVLWVLTKLRII